MSSNRKLHTLGLIRNQLELEVQAVSAELQKINQLHQNNKKKLQELYDYKSEYYRDYELILKNNSQIDLVQNYQKFVEHLSGIIQQQERNVFLISQELEKVRVFFIKKLEKKKNFEDHYHRIADEIKMEKEHRQQKNQDRENSDKYGRGVK
ncbi:MAG: flagellar export protein FliJ [Gammaproteobacteria bacterium]